MKRSKPSLFLFLIFAICSGHLTAQDSANQKQIWPELDAYFRVSEKFRVYALISGTKSNSDYTDGTTAIFIDYFALPWLRGRRNETEMSDSARGYFWWFRTGYSYSAPPAGDGKKNINILETETNNNFRLPAKIVLTTRNRLDWRWVNGDFQPIYRPRARFEKNLKTEYLTFDAYLWGEYFFYLNDKALNRFRLCFGTEIKVLKYLNFETYYLHQFVRAPSVESLNAIGIQVNLYFSSKHYKKQIAE